MSISSLLAVVDGGPASSAVLAAAVQIGRRYDAYVEALHVQLDPDSSIPLVGEGMSGAMVEQISADLRRSVEDHAKVARTAYEDACRGVDAQPLQANGKAEAGKFVFAWRSVTGREESETAQRALVFDLVIAGRPDAESDGAYAPALEAALFEAGRPVLVVPPGYEGAIGSKMVVGWTGQRECARAVTAALPLLAGAEAVEVVHLNGGEKPPEGNAHDPHTAVAWLTLHGVDARAREVALTDGAGDTLLTTAAEAGANLLVMGAYGHSRLREFVLGGATREVLTHTSLPVLMAH
ncbi:universal stress protein [Algihabitans albus]|uniref:universal stress protein n=1 Tax=Algihabitans albus TaxID=2164067 RepID=UPI0013C3733C|nr:universal stress protein [Algihabitans albus]